MKIHLPPEVYKDLIYEANLQQKSSAALIAQIVSEYLENKSSPNLRVKQKDNKNDTTEQP